MSDRYRSKTLRNLLLSLAVVLVPVAVIMAVFTHDPEEKPKAVDWQQPLAGARSQATYPVLAPQVPAGWTATRADWTPKGVPGPDGKTAVGNTWVMAWVSPDHLYYGLSQRDAQGSDLIADASRGGRADGTSVVKTVTWTRYQSLDERTRALATTDGDVTTVVSGDVPYASLEQFAATLAG